DRSGLVNIGARDSSIKSWKEGRSTLPGDVPVGGAEYSDALVRQLGLSPADAEALKTGRPAQGVDAGTAEPVLASVTEFIVEEIQRALSFFWTAATDEPLGGIILSGGTARMPGLPAQLTQRLGCAVEVANPFRRLQVELKAIEGPYADALRIEQQKQELREKLRVIGQLEAKKVGPVRILADLSSAIPDKLWLTDFSDQGGTLRLTGIGVDEQTVADFLRRLGTLP